MRITSLHPLLLALLLANLAGCTELPASYVSNDRPAITGDSARLTYSSGDDRDPAWGAADSLIYAGGGFPPFAAATSMIYTISSGRPVSEVFPGGNEFMRWVTPAPAPAGAQLAYVSLDRMSSLRPCAASRTTHPPDTSILTITVQAPLERARIIVQTRGASADAFGQALGVQFASVSDTAGVQIPGVPAGVPVYVTRVYPFQAAYRDGGLRAFRPSWSPDGRDVVFSDGLKLLRWHVGDSTAVPVTGGAGLVAAAWGPRPDLIAATRFVVTDSAVLALLHYDALGPACAELRVSYTQAPARLVLLAPDGTQRDLGEGESPAWAPDGSAVYVRRASTNDIWRAPVDGSAPARVPGTQGGADPAISRAGDWLAFTRLTARDDTTFNHDLYLVRLTH